MTTRAAHLPDTQRPLQTPLKDVIQQEPDRPPPTTTDHKGKHSPTASGQLGVVLNCRGGTEIAIAAVGYQTHLVNAHTFALLCGLAILTTAVTAPLFRALSRVGRLRDRTRALKEQPR